MDSPEQKRRTWLICLTLALGTLAVFGRVAGFDFINFDDLDYVTDNLRVRAGLNWDGVAWAFTTGFTGNWHPLTWLSHMLDYDLYGLKAAGHHLTSLAFHIANSLLLFTVLKKMTGAIWRGAIVAAFFAWHPLHVESVVWVSERKDVLSTFFWMLTLWAYVEYAQPAPPFGVPSSTVDVRSSKSRFYYRLSLLFFALGLMSKPMLVTLPFVLLLLDFWPLRRTADWASPAIEPDPAPATTAIELRNPAETLAQSSSSPLPKGRGARLLGPFNSTAVPSWTRLLWEKVPFFALAVASSVVTFIVQRTGGSVAALQALTAGQRAANAIVSYARYLGKTFWPHDLAIFYPLHRSWPAWEIAGAALLLIVISLAAIALARRSPGILVGWLWFLGTLTPVIGLVQVGRQSMADRYTYVPLIGIFILLVWGAADLAGHLRWGKTALAGTAAALLAACLGAAFVQVGYWRNNEALFRHALAVTSDNAMAHINLALTLAAQDKMDEAASHFKTALQIEPGSPIALNGLGLLFARRGDTAQAMECYTLALQNQPTLADAHYNLANLLVAQGNLPSAAEHYEAALQYRPGTVDALQNLGVVLVKLGKPGDAIPYFVAALRSKPDFPQAQDQLAGALLALGRADEAVAHYVEAIRLNPDFAHAHTRLGLILAQQGKFPEAGAHFQKVIALEPGNADAHYNLASACYSQKRYDEAAREFSEAARLQPDDAVTQGRLAASLARAGKSGPAIATFRGALRLKPDWPEALNGLAYILATSPKSEIRDGAEAMKLAERACELTQRRDPRYLATLDMACAEAGRFDDAIKTAQQVQELATAAGQPEAAATAAQRLALYRAGKPFHEP